MHGSLVPFIDYEVLHSIADLIVSLNLWELIKAWELQLFRKSSLFLFFFFFFATNLMLPRDAISQYFTVLLSTASETQYVLIPGHEVRLWAVKLATFFHGNY